MKAINVQKGKDLSDRVEVADNLFKRMKGLLGKNDLRAGESLLIKSCNSIHTFFMKFPIDVIFLNRQNEVIATIENLQPNRITRLYLRAFSVLELPTGTIEATSTEVGDKIEIK